MDMNKRHNWDAIRQFPVSTSGVKNESKYSAGSERSIHESCFRSYQILEHVKEMLKRGDSTETITEFIEYCEQT